MTHSDDTHFDILGKIDYERNKRKWSYYALAEYSGIPQSTISSWFQHRHQPSISSVEQICLAFGISLSDFFSEINSNSRILSEEQLELLALWEHLTPVQRSSLLNLLSTAFISV